MSHLLISTKWDKFMKLVILFDKTNLRQKNGMGKLAMAVMYMAVNHIGG